MSREFDFQIEALEAQLECLRQQKRDAREEARNLRKPKRRCGHEPMKAFRVGEQDWRCSHCGLIGRWGPTWMYYGCLLCRKCGCEPAIEFVACSEKCADALEKAAA